MSVRLKTVQELMSDGATFETNGSLSFNGGEGVGPQEIHKLGTVISDDEYRGDWNEKYLAEKIDDDVTPERAEGSLWADPNGYVYLVVAGSKAEDSYRKLASYKQVEM